MHRYDEMTEPELKAHFTELAGAIKSRLPPETGFMLVVAPFASHGVAQYVGNVDRSCAAEWMGETLERWQRNEDIQR